MGRFLKDEEIGEKLKEARIAKGLTQTELAQKLGVGQSAVGKWERGIVTNIKRSMIQQIASALDISPLLVVGIIPEEKDKPKTITISAEDFSEEDFSHIEQFVEFMKNKKVQSQFIEFMKQQNEAEKK